MTSVEQVIERIEAVGGVVAVDGDDLRCRLPEDQTPLLEEVRAHKAEILTLLRRRSRASLEAERKFGQPHAKLFPLIGRKVRTPGGPGTLLQVYADRVTVLLDSDLKHCSWFPPEEINPVSEGI